MHTEDDRIKKLKSLYILDTPEEQQYDTIALSAKQIADTPMALISLIDETRQWFKARTGISERETERESAFCAHALREAGSTLIVQDAWEDARFAANRLVVGKPNIRFYAGAPIVTSDGYALGTVCVLDTVPREFTSDQIKKLEALADEVSQMIQRDSSKFAKGAVNKEPTDDSSN